MFLGEDRLPVVRRMILAQTPEDEAAALEELRVVQKADFIEILEAMDGLPVTVRLLDPPLHEFLPRIDELEIKQATVGLTPDEEELLAAARSWHEFNPMLGTRGVRLGVVKPGLYAMQVRALMEAAAERVAAGGKPVVEIMIPLTVTREELGLARSWVEDAIAAATKGLKKKPNVIIGTMIETPRAAIRADEIAEEADFFSFGTNDLTQMTFGFSRDDVESRMMPIYLEEGLLKRNPFETIDISGRGRARVPRCRARPQDQARPQARRVRRARRRPRVDRPLLRRRARLRELLAVPGADRPAGGRTGRARRWWQRHPIARERRRTAHSGARRVELRII